MRASCGHFFLKRERRMKEEEGERERKKGQKEERRKTINFDFFHCLLHKVDSFMLLVFSSSFFLLFLHFFLSPSLLNFCFFFPIISASGPFLFLTHPLSVDSFLLSLFAIFPFFLPLYDLSFFLLCVKLFSIILSLWLHNSFNISFNISKISFNISFISQHFLNSRKRGAVKYIRSTKRSKITIFRNFFQKYFFT